VKIVGIDYSMTSPAVTVIMDNRATCRFLTSVKRNQTSGVCEMLAWHGDPYPDYKTAEERFDLISEWAVLQCIDADVIVLEDYAMGAKGKVFHLGENCGLLKHKLWQRGLKFETVAPTALKKFASGKGNSDKCAMLNAFVKETGIDLMKQMDKESKDCGSPVSDVVDSFYLAQWGIKKQLQM